ncbi:MAG: Crp/Fnr family transcriptional regulator [Oscillospiraceae bacterium]|nr:Crp/Fnr family transcriptional regulator [Oscillospiraceae bacterium]
MEQTKTFKMGEVIFREGDKGDCMYDIRLGRVGIYRAYGTARQSLLAVLGPDETFGEMGMHGDEPRSATAVSMDARTLLQVVNWDTFGTYFRERPAKVVAVIQQMGKRMRELTKQYTELNTAVLNLMKSLELDGKPDQAEQIRENVGQYLNVSSEYVWKDE